MKKFAILLCFLAFGCAHKQLENTGSATGLGSSPFSAGGSFTATQANSINNAVNDNDTRLDTIEGLPGLVFSLGDGTYANMSGISQGEVGYLNGVTGGLYYSFGPDVAVTDGGTGSSTAAGARTNLGLVIGTDVLAPNGDGSSLTGVQLELSEGQFANGDKTKLDGLDADKIEEGDTEFETVDSGTGYAETVVDGEQQLKVSDGYSENPTGFIYRVITTTDGHVLKFQVYDANGTTWRDALTLENGDSSDSSTTNWPRVHLGSNVALTGLGNSAIGMSWGTEVSSSPVTLTYTDANKLYLVSVAATVNLPDVGTASDDAQYGDWVQFQIQDASETLTIDCDAADKINRAGTAQAAGVTITTDGAGTVVTCIATTNADGSGTDGWMCRSNGTLAQGS